MQLMTWKYAAALLLAIVSACGGHGTTPAGKDDASVRSSDAAPSAGTRVTGVLGGTSFVLTYGAISREPSGLIWVCAANVAVTYADCSSTAGPARTMFLGPFGYDQNSNARWSIPQVGLFRVGASPLSEM